MKIPDTFRPLCPKCDTILDYWYEMVGKGLAITVSYCPICGWKDEKGKEENVMSQKQWWIRAYQKLLENMLSVKVWILGGNAIISAWLVWKFQTPDTIGTMFSDWCAFNGGVVTAIIGLREAFKVAKVKNGNGENKDVLV